MARTFKDADGREWTVKVTVDVIERVREIDVDLGDLTTATIKRLAMDDVLLVRTLWLICEQQADARSISPGQFGEAMVGEPLETAFDALRGSLEDFFPPRKRAFWTAMVEADLASQAQALQIGMETLENRELREQFGQAMRDRVKAEIGTQLTRLKSATGSPGS